jgi:hypothetical protein
MKRLLTLCALVAMLTACNNAPQPDPIAQKPKHPGQALHTTYCGACHAIPEPAELDKATWKNSILVRMGAYMGIYYDNVRYYDSVPAQWVEPGPGGERVRAGNIYPSKPVITREEFEQLRDYVLQNAPDKTLGPNKLLPIDAKGIPGFTPHLLRPDTQLLQPLLTAIAIDTTQHEIYAAYIQQEILRIQPQGRITQRIDGFMGPVQLLPRPQGITLLDIGSMGGSDDPKGLLVAGKDLKALKSRPSTNMEALQRPVFAQYGDLDSDGDEDMVLCEFGYHFGELAWHEQTAAGKYTRHTLHPDDGAVCARIHDFNQDNQPDILVLTANADERLELYVNEGQGKFKKKLLFRFSPTFGCTYIELVDWDKDGQMDILMVNGDNGDYAPILKASHGIRLYKNLGALKFKEEFFIGMNGAYGLRARDFDRDGDTDIAAVSFYPDYKGRPEEAFIYYQNQGGNTLRAFTFPEVKLSRWMVLDAGDMDGDGDEDIVLGAFNVKSGDASDATYAAWMKENAPIVWLENTLPAQ